MSKATQAQRIAAERLLALELVAGKRAVKGPAVARVAARFRHVLTTLLGDNGFRALLARALFLAQAEAPELSAT
jgi:hypothetical protein